MIEVEVMENPEFVETVKDLITKKVASDLEEIWIGIMCIRCHAYFERGEERKLIDGAWFAESQHVVCPKEAE